MNLGNIARNIFDTSTFGEDTYKGAADSDNGAYRIVITPNIRALNGGADSEIVGIITGNISVSMDAQYDTLGIGSLVSNFPIIEKIFNYAAAPLAVNGISVNNAGLVTEKFYTKSGYLEIDPSFRVVNWNGDGKPLLAAVLLINFCTPKKAETIENIIEKIGGAIKKAAIDKNLLAQIAEAGIELISEGAKLAVKGYTYMANEVSPSIGKAIQNTAAKTIDSNDAFLLTSSPTPVSVKIGNYFEHKEMIIESVSCDFSSQMTQTGPLYADFKVKLSSKRAAMVDTQGFVMNKKRVSVEGQSLNTTGVK